MIKSMTGYGNEVNDQTESSLKAEVKALNSKFLDLTIRLPRRLSDKELEVKAMIGKILERGKITVSVDIDSQLDLRNISYNQELFVKNYNDLKELADMVKAPINDLFKIALSAPDVIKSGEVIGDDEEEWNNILKVLEKAAKKCNQFRVDEGQKLKIKLSEYTVAIRTALDKIIEQEPRRLKNLKDRIEGGLKEFGQKAKIDENRYEQELIYYIEKLDISEEKVRLTSHLDYFLEIMESDGSQGKKLGFIAQEIGREINTIGSKANDAVIQKHVVEMKEELEKIKEQLLNIL